MCKQHTLLVIISVVDILYEQIKKLFKILEWTLIKFKKIMVTSLLIIIVINTSTIL